MVDTDIDILEFAQRLIRVHLDAIKAESDGADNDCDLLTRKDMPLTVIDHPAYSDKMVITVSTRHGDRPNWKIEKEHILGLTGPGIFNKNAPTKNKDRYNDWQADVVAVGPDYCTAVMQNRI
jgi:hypothetical protein